MNKHIDEFKELEKFAEVSEKELINIQGGGGESILKRLSNLFSNKK